MSQLTLAQGGVSAALARGRAEVATVCHRPLAGQLAVDLGAGFGMHAIPLADMGYSVLAIDSCASLLGTMQSQLATRSIKIVRDDLRSFKKHLTAPATLIVCMGDTLTHLPDKPSVEDLIADVAAALVGGGQFVVTFRDYTTPLIDSQRFILVRSDSDRMLTCFLEYDADAVTVYDILNEREGSDWRQRISTYRKLRLSPDWVAGILEAKGLDVRIEQGPGGAARLIAMRPL